MSGALVIDGPSPVDPTNPWNWARSALFASAVIAAVAGGTSFLLRELVKTLKERTDLIQKLRDEALEREKTHAQLAETQERLLHAHKLEVVGRLAGGIAHDFNNTLTVILSYGELIKSRLGRDNPISELADQVIQAAEQGGDLTKQLLTFTRRQIVKPRTVDVQQILRNTERALTRLVPRSINIRRIESPDELYVTIDPTQLQQAILNLALNARDAMADGGGDLFLEASQLRSARPRRAAADARSLRAGARARHRHRHARPRRCRACSSRSSPPRSPAWAPDSASPTCARRPTPRAATWRSRVSSARARELTLYLPRADARISGVEATQPTSSARQHTLLVVDDEPQIREVIRTMLVDNGYVVRTADSARLALEILRDEQIDLVCTDLVMPEMSGSKLIDELKRTRPRAAHRGLLGLRHRRRREPTRDPRRGAVPVQAVHAQRAARRRGPRAAPATATAAPGRWLGPEGHGRARVAYPWLVLLAAALALALVLGSCSTRDADVRSRARDCIGLPECVCDGTSRRRHVRESLPFGARCSRPALPHKEVSPWPDSSTSSSEPTRCGALRGSDIDKEVVLFGWVQNRRDHGGCIFIDLRDREGITQMVFDPNRRRGLVRGRRRRRGPSGCSACAATCARAAATRNPNLATGEIEVVGARGHGLQPRADAAVRDRRQHRHQRGEAARVPLPRPAPAHAAEEHPDRARKLNQITRSYFAGKAFVEVETPFMVKYTPGGARNFLVPVAPAPRQLLRARREPAAVQAAVHGRRLRPLLPDRALLPRRGPAPRPPARVHADRRRDELRQPGRHLRRHGGLHLPGWKEILGIDLKQRYPSGTLPAHELRRERCAATATTSRTCASASSTPT